MFQLNTVIVPQNLCGMFWNKKSTETPRIFHENKLFKMVIWAHFSSWKLIGNECKKKKSFEKFGCLKCSKNCLKQNNCNTRE